MRRSWGSFLLALLMKTFRGNRGDKKSEVRANFHRTDFRSDKLLRKRTAWPHPAIQHALSPCSAVLTERYGVLRSGISNARARPPVRTDAREARILALYVLPASNSVCHSAFLL